MAKSNPLRPLPDKPARRSSTFGARVAADLLRAAPTSSSAESSSAESSSAERATASTPPRDFSGKPLPGFSGKQSYVRELSRPGVEVDVVRIPTTPGFRVPLPGAFGEGAAAAKPAEQPSHSAQAEVDPQGVVNSLGNSSRDLEAEPAADERSAIYPEHDSDDTNDVPFSESPAALAADLLASGSHSPEPANDRVHAQSERPPVSKRETSVGAIASASLDAVTPSGLAEEDAEQTFARILERSTDAPPTFEGTDLNREPLIEPLASPPSLPPVKKRYGAVTLAAVFVGVCASVFLLGELWTSASSPSVATSANSEEGEHLTELLATSESDTTRPSAAAPKADQRGSTPDTPASFTQAVRFEDLPSDADNPTAGATPASTNTQADGVSSTNPVAESDTSKPASIKAEAPRAEPGTRGTLAVNSIPASTVYIDGRHVGHTPKLGLSISAGAHEIKLEHPRHRTHTQIVTIEADKKRVLSHRF